MDPATILLFFAILAGDCLLLIGVHLLQRIVQAMTPQEPDDGADWWKRG